MVKYSWKSKPDVPNQWHSFSNYCVKTTVNRIKIQCDMILRILKYRIVGWQRDCFWLHNISSLGVLCDNRTATVCPNAWFMFKFVHQTNLKTLVFYKIHDEYTFEISRLKSWKVRDKLHTFYGAIYFCGSRCQCCAANFFSKGTGMIPKSQLSFVKKKKKKSIPFHNKHFRLLE